MPVSLTLRMSKSGRTTSVRLVPPNCCRGTDGFAVDRTKNSRMGWSDISISLSGPIVDSLSVHFVDRW